MQSLSIQKSPAITSPKKYEIEVKSLLGTGENAYKLFKNILDKGIPLRYAGHEEQLNHYFSGGSILKLSEIAQKEISDKDVFGEYRQLLSELAQIPEEAKCSVRTRYTDGKSILVVKIALNEASSTNGIARREIEIPLKQHLFPMEQLDQMILDAGYDYQSKWSRNRDTYILTRPSTVKFSSSETIEEGTGYYDETGVFVEPRREFTLTIDKNAGYGYVAEIELMVDDESEAEDGKEDILSMMELIGINELPQDRLDRMFKHYSSNWSEYYGTERVFEIE